MADSSEATPSVNSQLLSYINRRVRIVVEMAHSNDESVYVGKACDSNVVTIIKVGRGFGYVYDTIVPGTGISCRWGLCS